MVADLYTRLLNSVCDQITVVQTIEEMRARLVSEPPPDVVLLDLVRGAKTVQEIKAIREVNPDAVIVIATGNASPEVVKEAMTHGADYYAVKPETNTHAGLIQAILRGARRLESKGRIALIETLTEAMRSKSTTQRLT